MEKKIYPQGIISVNVSGLESIEIHLDKPENDPMVSILSTYPTILFYVKGYLAPINFSFETIGDLEAFIEMLNLRMQEVRRQIEKEIEK